ncbi:MAG: FecR domain-containing protein [Geminicoccaceae bacterium]|jgi:hypothetical protein|nr:FecR domain-containing protein [Geminicoccaceae bacterium]HRY25116.1 FecR domain-containing protein [Geminicoccaceae bacterium]
MRWIGAALLLGAPAALAVVEIDGPLTTVRVEQGQSIRDLAALYLKDPDLWPQIIEFSGLGSVVDVRPGIELKVPVVQVAAADDALAISLVSIQKATAEGARIFAPIEIGTAIEKRDEAVEYRTAGEWREVVVHANEATAHAEQALDISLQQRDRAAEAVLSDIHGAVEGSKPVETGWSGRRLNDFLIEFERLRTLSASTAQVTFRDLSRLRLNPNSNAVIQRMRSDPLTGAETTKVSLVEGDFYALLNQLHNRADFEVEVPGVETEATSADFWVSHDSAASRFANYDDAEMRIKARGQTIGLGRNEGALVPANEGDLVEVTVLDRPVLFAPSDREQIFNGTVALAWQGTAEAAGYWLEIAGDVDFNAMKVSEWGLTDRTKTVERLDAGDYFWRISALDAYGLPGERSLVRSFTAVLDATPPFLTVLAPGEDAILRDAAVRVSGESEPRASLTVNGAPVPPDETGRFEAHVEAVPGLNEVVLEAIDRAGNRTSKTRRFTYRADRLAALGFDPSIPTDDAGHLLTRGPELGVSGSSTAEPGSRLIVRDATGEVVADALVAEDGRFAFTVEADEAGAAYEVEVVAVSGAAEGGTGFTATRDALPPELSFGEPPPRATAVRWLQLWGSAGDAVALAVNGTDLAITDGSFETLLSLVPGSNPIELVATDRVGNVAMQELAVVLDLDPPEVGAAEVRRTGGADDGIEIVVAATDATDLKQAAAYTLSVDGEERSGYLRYDPESGLYRETLPPAGGRLKLVEVTVEDYAGNATVRRFD